MKTKSPGYCVTSSRSPWLLRAGATVSTHCWAVSGPLGWGSANSGSAWPICTTCATSTPGAVANHNLRPTSSRLHDALRASGGAPDSAGPRCSCRGSRSAAPHSRNRSGVGKSHAHLSGSAEEAAAAWPSQAEWSCGSPPGALSVFPRTRM
ncbi:hypothetical protein B484DRAFT_455556 [Ochromonadaceae sp. CCMP2298]|nr:hypothetical protein B484DRAFT_455556 [Ochromonadaceae sp. CCMP2298]